MQASHVFILLALASVGGDAAASSPLGKVIDLLTGLEGQIVKEGEESAKLNAEKETWCKDTSTNLGFEIKTGTSEVEELEAKIGKEAAAISSLTEKIEDLASGIAKSDKDLAAATKIRAEEAADFAAEESELKETLSALQRAIGILQKEMAKSGGAALVQLQGASSVVEALDVMVKASMFSKTDASTLSSFVQSQQQSQEDESAAPAAAAYTSQSGGIVDVLEELLDKATAQLSDARKKEESAMQDFAMLKQSLEDEMKFSTKEKGEAEAAMAKSGEEKSTAEGALSATSEDLSGDKASLEEVTKDCAAAAEEFAAESQSRSEELAAVKVAIKALSEKAGGADGVAYGSAAVLLQERSARRSSLSTGADLANFEAVRLVRELARRTHSSALAQLATHMATAVRLGATGADPFSKVKGLITDMISKLESEASQDAEHKAYCDEEMADAKAKQSEKKTLVEKLSTKIGQMTAASAKLKDSVATLQTELAELAASQQQMDAMRKQESDLFATQKKELTEGISGVEIAIKSLKEYYGQAKDHEANDGAAGSIIGMLEVCMSDFTKTLTELTAAEDSAQSEYESTTQSNKIEKASKDKDVKYQTKEAADLDKAVTESTADRATTQSELEAVEEYLTKLEDMCVAKPETYEERASRRDEEVKGLKEALSILEGQASMMQRRSLRRAPH